MAEPGRPPPERAAIPSWEFGAPGKGGRLVENIMHFARGLRVAGLEVGPGTVLTAIEAVECVGVKRRDDFYWALHAVFVRRQDQQDLFDQAFHLFWRDPRFLERMTGLQLPDFGSPPAESAKPIPPRLSEAFGPKSKDRAGDDRDREPDRPEIDAVLTYSYKEIMQTLDFEKMSAQEIALAKAAIAKMRLPILEIPTRRFRGSPNGRRADPRATARAALRSGSDTIPLRWKTPRRRHPPLVIICDISGSMKRYSRMLVHFMHAVTNDRDRVHTFLFGTRLTNITRHLRRKDVDLALEKVADAAPDWSGGTRIGACLRDFNLHWSRRVLGQGAVVLFISDGLDRDEVIDLGAEMARLHRSCRRLIWLNPLLRYPGYEPKSIGAKAIMPHVDEVRTVHNLESLSQLTQVLSKPVSRRQEAASAPFEATQ